MNHFEEEPEQSVMKLHKRLQKIYLNDDSPDESSPPFKHHDMIVDMMSKACYLNRDFLDDIFRLIGIYYCHGSNNTRRILNEWDGSPKLKQRLIEMIDVYGIVDTVRWDQHEPTLSRITEALPHVSVMLASEINANPFLGLKLWVSDKDLGAPVHYLFKINCFPSMIHIGSGMKAQACLFFFNLCHAKALDNMHTQKNVVNSFITSCRYSTYFMNQKMAPLKSRINFTNFIETLPLSAELMFRVWNSVLGKTQIPLFEMTAVTYFHERVLQSQPSIDLTKIFKENNIQ